MVRVKFPEGERMENGERMNNHKKSDLEYDPSSKHDELIQ